MKKHTQPDLDRGFPETDEPRGPMYHRSSYGEPAYYAAAYGGEPGDEEGIDLLKLLRVLLRRWYTVAIFLVVGGLAAWLYGQKATPIYQAEAELEMSVRRPKVINSQAVYDDTSSSMSDTDAIINTRFAKFRSPAMERMAIEEYQKRFPGEERSVQALSYYVRENISWSKDRRSNIVRVSTLSPDPRFAAQLVNVLSFCAGALMIQENQALSDGAVQWLHAQVEEQRSSLDGVEKQLATLRSSIQLDSLGQRKDALGAALNKVAAEKSTIENKLEARKATYDFVVEILTEKQDVEKLPSGLPKEAEINALITVWRKARNELEKCTDTYTEHHPEYQRLHTEERRARKEVEDFIAISGEAIKNEIRLLERQLEQLVRRVETMEQESISLEQKLVNGEQQLISLERRREAADDAYRAILQRMEQARMSADENTAFINIIREATIPRNPVKPRKLVILALGLFIGTLFGAGLAFLIEFWSDKITLVGDLKDLNLNILGTIPSQKNVETRRDLATIGLKDKFSHVFEIFAGINTLVSADRYKDRTHVILICSVMPGEGKTISSCNLAISSALNNTRTLLIDGDLRRPRLARIFGIKEEHASLLEWLSADDGSLDCEHLVNHDVHKNLDIITSRPSRNVNPAELMGRAKLRELIEWGRKNYDRIIIDSPPLGMVGDSHALANQSDSVIVVSRIGKTKKRALKFALGRLVELDATVLGCIANDVPHSLAGMFKGAHDGYSYGYGGYGAYKSYGREDDA
ncbi:GumC family protein [Pontiella sp.]|uniref:GumC family protein n=1 Tax=Pontiella sp. TaxID=2837462 RepID=UPI003568C50B